MKDIVQNKKIHTLILIVLTVIVFYFLLKDNFNEVMIELLDMNILWIILTCFLILGSWLFKAIGVNLITRQIKPDFKMKDSININLTVQFFNAITPFSVGGHPVQVYLMNKKGISLTNGTNITIQNFIVYQIAIIFIQIFSLIFAFSTNLFGNNHFIKTLVLAGFGFDFIIVIGLFILAFSKKLKYVLIHIGITILSKLKLVKNREEKLEHWNNRIKVFHENALVLIKNKKKFAIAIICNFIALIALYLTPLTILYGTSNYTNFDSIQSISTTACVVMAGDLLPTPGQTGGIEYLFTSLFTKFLNPAKLSAVLIAWRFLSYYLTLIVGSIVINMKKKLEKN